MYKELLKKQWKHFLIDIDKTEQDISKTIKTPASNINRKINTGTIKYVELLEILEKYGYTFKIIRKE